MTTGRLIQIGPDRWLVKTSCHECFFDVCHYHDLGHIDVSLLSSHVSLWVDGWRKRLRQAWDVLRGKRGEFFISMIEAEEADALIAALILARLAAFGDPSDLPPTGSQAPDRGQTAPADGLVGGTDGDVATEPARETG